MGGWNLWKLTAIAMVLVTATAVVTGLVVAYWSGSAPERGLKHAAVSSPPAPPQAPSRQPTAPAPQSRASTVPRQVAAKPEPAVSPQPAVTPQPAPRVPTQEAIDACNRYAAAQAGQQDKAMQVAKDAVIGAVAGATLGVGRWQPVHLPHRRFGRPSVVGRAQVLEDRPLRLARLLLLDRLVYRVVHAAPLGADPVVLDVGPTDGLRDLDNFLFEERRRAERGAPRDFVSQPAEERDDRRHLRDGRDPLVRLARVAEVVADPAKELVVVRRAAHPAVEVGEFLDEQVARAVLADLEVLAARVNAAEDAGERGDQQGVLGDVPPHVGTAQRARGEPPEVFRAPEGALREELRRQRVEPALGRHAGSSVSPAGLYRKGALPGGGFTRRSWAAAGDGWRARTRTRGESATARSTHGPATSGRGALRRPCSPRAR